MVKSRNKRILVIYPKKDEGKALLLKPPKTGELIYRPEKINIRFKAGKKLNKIINK